jgi:GNAT superfamily N-acetyltransferase
MIASALEVSIRLLQDGEQPPELDSGDADLDNWLREDATRLHGQGVAAVYLAHVGDQFVGYAALLVDCIKVNSTEKKKIHLQHDDHPVIPALKVGRLAVNKTFQNRGIGSTLIRFSIDTALSVAELAGCRLLTLDAYPAKVDWYERRGFVRNRRLAKEAAAAWKCPDGCPEHMPVDGTPPVNMWLDFTVSDLHPSLRGLDK